MRRISAILLLVAFSLPLFAAALQDSDANLPACCRRAGIHHCGAMGHVGSGSTTGPALESGACPNFPTTATLGAFVKITLPGPVGALPSPERQFSAAPSCGRLCSTVVPDDSNLKRGPPSLFS